MTQFLPPDLYHTDAKYYRRWKKIPKGFYRIAAKAIVMNKEWKILLLREGRFADKKSELYRNDRWMFDLPGGWIDYGEYFRDGLIRELSEEIWLSSTEIIVWEQPLYVQTTELDDRYYDDIVRNEFYPVCLFYYPVRLLHYDFQESPECSEFEWVHISEFKDYPIWSHSMWLVKIFDPIDFPESYIS